jgi:hypothetical protein
LGLPYRFAGKYRPDIDYRRPINHFYRTNPQPLLAYLSYRHPMKPQRIRSVRRSRCKYSRQCSLRVRTRMDLENLPPPLVQPGHHKEFVSFGDSLKPARRERIHFQPSVRCSFRTLFRRSFSILDCRSNRSDRAELQPFASHLCSASSPRSVFPIVCRLCVSAAKLSFLILIVIVLFSNFSHLDFRLFIERRMPAPIGHEMTLWGNHMRHFYIGSLALILLLTWPSNSFADGIAISNATLDWTGFTFTVTSGLTVSVVDEGDFAFSFASTTLGEPSSAQGSNTSAFSQYSTSTANGVARAAIANGFVATSSQASTTSLQPSINFAESSVFIERNFFLYGSGVGTLTVSIPFTLSVACNSSQPLGSPAVDLTTAADASVFLEIRTG